MYEATTWMAVAAVVAAGTGIYMAVQGPPDLPPPPTPASAYTYNNDGSVTMQRWDEAKKAYITEYDPEPEPKDKPEWNKYLQENLRGKNLSYPSGYGGDTGQLSLTVDEVLSYSPVEPKKEDFTKDGYFNSDGYGRAVEKWSAAGKYYNETRGKYEDSLIEWGEGNAEWQEWKLRDDKRVAERTLRDGLETQYLQFLDAPPAERVAQYEKYRDEYVTTMRDEVLPAFEKKAQEMDVVAEKKGMTGSRYHADLKKDLEETKSKIESSIEHQGYLQAQQFEQSDINNALNVLGYLESAGSAEHAKKMGEAGMTQTVTQMGNAYKNAQYGADINKAMLDYQHQMDTASSMMDTAGGLAFLYGYGKGGGNIKPDKTTKTANVSNYLTSGGSKPYSRLLQPNLSGVFGT